MGKTYDHIPEKVAQWIGQQELFWVATAPLSGDGHVNVSPKGLRGTFFVENSNKVWYEDLSGSGCETIARLRENGRITFMFNAFEGAAEIVRLYGIGTVHELGSPEYDARISSSNRKPGSRAVIVADIHRVSTSCGFGVPFYKFEGHRTTLYSWCGQLEKNDRKFESSADGGTCENGMKGWWRAENLSSVDGLPPLEDAPFTSLTLDGKMPEPTEAAFRKRVPKSALIEGLDPMPTQFSQIALSKSNVKLALGLLIGFSTAFVLPSAVALAKRLGKPLLQVSNSLSERAFIDPS